MMIAGMVILSVIFSLFCGFYLSLLSLIILSIILWKVLNLELKINQAATLSGPERPQSPFFLWAVDSDFVIVLIILILIETWVVAIFVRWEIIYQLLLSSRVYIFR